MKIGLSISRFTWPGGAGAIRNTLADIARAAEAAGFYSIWLMDHFFQIEFIGPYEEEMLEGYSGLSYLAGVTEKVKLGTLVTGVIYRYPGILVKTATTLDVLSGGRAYFGIGAAWNEQESKGLGVPFPPIARRFEMLEEAVQIAKQMWSDNNGPYHGRHYTLEETLCSPQPLSRPYPPIMIGGGGEKKTLRLVAQYADACNLFDDPESVRHKLDVLRRHCDAVGRDFDSIEITSAGRAHIAPGKMSVKDVIEKCRTLAGLGVDHAMLAVPNAFEMAPLELFAEKIIPEVAEL